MFNDLFIEVLYENKHTLENILQNPNEKTDRFERPGIQHAAANTYSI